MISFYCDHGDWHGCPATEQEGRAHKADALDCENMSGGKAAAAAAVRKRRRAGRRGERRGGRRTLIIC